MNVFVGALDGTLVGVQLAAKETNVYYDHIAQKWKMKFKFIDAPGKSFPKTKC